MADSDKTKTIDGFAYWIENEENVVCYIPLNLCKKIMELLKEHEPVKPHYNARTNWYECGACHYSMTSGMHCRSELIPATKVRYCANCGFPVNWEGW